MLNVNYASKIIKYKQDFFFFKLKKNYFFRVWKENNTAKRFSPQTAELYRSAFTLRQRMMNAIQNLEYYMMIEVIEPNWHIFIENMKKVS